VTAQRPWAGIHAHVLDEAGVVTEACRGRLPYSLSNEMIHCERVVLSGGQRWWTPGGGPIPNGPELLLSCGARARRSAAPCGHNVRSQLEMRQTTIRGLNAHQTAREVRS
jgi:hypothetical protein